MSHKTNLAFQIKNQVPEKKPNILTDNDGLTGYEDSTLSSVDTTVVNTVLANRT